MGSDDLTVECPNCGKLVDYARRNENPDFPFCCRRCKLVDLGKWLSEEHRIEGEDLQASQQGEGDA